MIPDLGALWKNHPDKFLLKPRMSRQILLLEWQLLILTFQQYVSRFFCVCDGKADCVYSVDERPELELYGNGSDNDI